jgi:hypothetical protein
VVVVDFFAALDGADPVAALDLVCTERRADFEDAIEQLIKFQWSVPDVLSDRVEGANRVLVVRVTRTRNGDRVPGRVAVTVMSEAGVPRVCDVADA